MTHNYNQQAGGEDAIVVEEYGLLSRNKINVELYEKRNESIKEMSPLQLAMDTLWSRKTIDNMNHVI